MIVTSSRLRGRLAPIALLVTAAVVAGACGAGGATPAPTFEEKVVVYSGRSEELVAPLLEQFEDATGIKVEVRYAGTSELAATILEEGDGSPADVFFSQDGGALGALANEGRLAALPAELVELVDPRFRSPDSVWVGLSGRARVLAYDTRELTAADMPASVQDLTKPEWKGRIGWAPTNASFQTFVTALRLELGDDAARAWLEGVQANEPRVYEGNSAALRGIAAGEVDVALINHYYLFTARANDASIPVENHFFTGGDPGALVNIAGAGVLSSAPHPVAAVELVRFLLSETAQTYFAEKTFEYAMIAGIPPAEGLPALEDIESPDIDLTDLDDLEGTIRLIQEAGIL